MPAFRAITFRYAVGTVDLAFRLTTRQEWTGSCFRGRNVSEVGLLVHLGHDGAPCPTPHRKCFKIITMDGLFAVNVSMCGCEASGGEQAQLIDMGWRQVAADTCLTTRVLSAWTEVMWD